MHATNNLFVVAVDFWEPSRHALEMAARFSKQFDGHVLAIHILERHAHYPDGIEVDQDTLEEDLQKALDALVAPYRDSGLQVETEVLTGLVTRQLSDICHEHQADALFVGLREGRILEDIFIGAHTLQLVKAAEMPVIVVDGISQNERIEELIIPLDRKFGIEGTLAFLRDLEKPLATRVQLLTTMHPDDDEQEVMADANQAASRLEALGVTETFIQLVSDKDTYGAMMDLLRASVGTFDLVLLEHHDHIALGELTLGSLIEDIVTGGRMPVLCAPAIAKR